jgi:hypothetical protein
LFNERKEILLHPTDVKKEKQVSFLVRPKEDLLGQQKKQMLEHHFGIKGIHTIRHGILWSVAGPNADTLSDHVINSHILYNPYAHDCYYY